MHYKVYLYHSTSRSLDQLRLQNPSKVAHVKSPLGWFCNTQPCDRTENQTRQVEITTNETGEGTMTCLHCL